MEPFVNVFFSIDKNQNESISLNELQEYAQENKLDDSMVTRWKSLFDPENTGTISFSMFCDVLGLKPEQARAMYTSPQSASKTLGSDITVVFEQMPIENQINISDEARRLANEDEKIDETKLASTLKQWLDTKYEKTWHVVLVKGSFWISYSYSQDKCFLFRMGDYSYLIWRTPDEEFSNK